MKIKKEDINLLLNTASSSSANTMSSTVSTNPPGDIFSWFLLNSDEIAENSNESSMVTNPATTGQLNPATGPKIDSGGNAPAGMERNMNTLHDGGYYQAANVSNTAMDGSVTTMRGPNEILVQHQGMENTTPTNAQGIEGRRTGNMTLNSNVTNKPDFLFPTPDGLVCSAVPTDTLPSNPTGGFIPTPSNVKSNNASPSVGAIVEEHQRYPGSAPSSSKPSGSSIPSSIFSWPISSTLSSVSSSFLSSLACAIRYTTADMTTSSAFPQQSTPSLHPNQVITNSDATMPSPSNTKITGFFQPQPQPQSAAQPHLYLPYSKSVSDTPSSSSTDGSGAVLSNNTHAPATDRPVTSKNMNPSLYLVTDKQQSPGQQSNLSSSTMYSGTKQISADEIESEIRRRRLERNRECARECRKRKREKIQNVEERCTFLERENIELRSQLKASKEEMKQEEEEKLKICLELEKMIQSNAKEEDIAKVIYSFEKQYSDYGHGRRSALRYHLHQLERLLLPTQVTKMCMWSLQQDDSFWKEPGEGSDATTEEEADETSLSFILSKEIGIAPEQKKQMRQHREAIIKICENIKYALSLLKTLREQVDKKNIQLDQEMEKLQKILSPTQRAKFIVWVTNNPACMHLLNELWLNGAKNARQKTE